LTEHTFDTLFLPTASSLKSEIAIQRLKLIKIESSFTRERLSGPDGGKPLRDQFLCKDLLRGTGCSDSKHTDTGKTEERLRFRETDLKRKKGIRSIKVRVIAEIARKEADKSVEDFKRIRKNEVFDHGAYKSGELKARPGFREGAGSSRAKDRSSEETKQQRILKKERDRGGKVGGGKVIRTENEA